MGGKTVLVTGGGRRLGAATVTALVEAGWTALVHVRTATEEAEALLAGLAETHEHDVGRDEDGGGLVAGHAEVDAVLDELDASMLVKHGVALNVADLESKGVDARSHGARIVGPGVIAHKTFVVEAPYVTGQVLAVDGGWGLV